GDTITTVAYDPHGNLTHRTGNPHSPLGYAGQYTDPETDLQYLRNRHYDPKTNLFLSRDPLETRTGYPYAYAGNDSVNNTDPLGLLPIPGTPWCIDIKDPNCNSIKEQHQETFQKIADGAAGVLDTISGGNADLILEH